MSQPDFYSTYTNLGLGIQAANLSRRPPFLGLNDRALIRVADLNPLQQISAPQYELCVDEEDTVLRGVFVAVGLMCVLLPGDETPHNVVVVKEEDAPADEYLFGVVVNNLILESLTKQLMQQSF